MPQTKMIKKDTNQRGVNKAVVAQDKFMREKRGEIK